MKVNVVSAGPMLTVQDTGRVGLRHLGVSTAGPIDMFSMALANALCGNPITTAALEFVGPGGRFSTERETRFAVASADCDIRIDDRLVAACESHRLLPGEILHVGAPRDGVWAYIAFTGGIDSTPVLGSRATHLRSGLGGLKGRSLRSGDNLPLGPYTDGPCLRLPRPLEEGRDRAGRPIRVILGPQNEHFSEEVQSRLTKATFQVTPQRDRMAMVLGGAELPAWRGHDVISDGTVPGSIQVPGSGMPLVLLTESQTTGGYPKIATVASVDLPRLAQLPVGSDVRFTVISRDEGEELWIKSRHTLRDLISGLIPKSAEHLRSDFLLGCDLVGGVTAPEEIAGIDLDAGESRT